ncbi:twin-arginine translocation signal domain-containing protein [Cupriavidus basilensis]
MSPTRRDFLIQSGALAAGAALPGTLLAQSAEAPRKGGVLTVLLGGEQRILNPALRASTGVYVVSSKMHRIAGGPGRQRQTGTRAGHQLEQLAGRQDHYLQAARGCHLA